MTDALISGLAFLATAAEPSTEVPNAVSIDLKPMIIWGGIVAVVAIFGIVEIIKSTNRERTRREIAAYVAEGTMTPEQAERLLNRQPNIPGSD